MWVYLAALVLAPLLAALGAGAAAALPHLREARQLQAAEALLHETSQIDSLRRAVDQELLPSLVLNVLRNDVRSREALLTGGLRTQLISDYERARLQARARTDAALATVSGSEASATPSHGLDSLRADADGDQLTPGLLTQRFLAISDGLAVAERTAALRAGASGVSPRTALAAADVSQLADLSALASRQLPLLFATLVTTGTERRELRTAWRSAAGGFDRVSAFSGSLSDPQLRAGVYAISTYGATAQLATRLSSPTALDGVGVGALVPGQVLDLVAPSEARDTALARLIHDAVAAATASSVADRARAQGELSLTTTLIVGAVLAVVAAASAVGRRLARSLGHLELIADQAHDGRHVVLLDRGPREVRRVAEALAHAASGLHRVRLQVEAVTRGDLTAASERNTATGGLQEAVHRSLQALVRAVEANDALRAELAVRASTDALTGLPNRAAALVALEGLCESPRTPEAPGAVLFLDLDGFKQVNDSLGHAAGDEVLRITAQRLLAQVSAQDVVGRLGGDEFVVIARDVNVMSAMDLAQRLIRAVALPVELDGGRTALVGASAGLATPPARPCRARELLNQADAAVYAAKAAGRGCVRVADTDVLAPAASSSD